MTKEQKMKMRLAKARQTALGRFLCRLAGEQRGAVMMEYVVLGVLVVAAVVAIVMAFGDGLQNRFKVMLSAIFGHKSEMTTEQQEGESTKGSNISAADAHHGTMQGGGQ